MQRIRFTCFLLLVYSGSFAQFPQAYTGNMTNKAETDPLTRVYLTPQRIVWKSGDSLIVNADLLPLTEK